MGRVKEDAFGGFSGKVGNVVGASWKGINYIRSLPAKVNDPKTKKQVKQRSRFSITMDFLKTITPFLRIGFQSHTNGRMTAFNAAMSYNMKYAVKGEQQDMGLDYQSVLVSRGPLSVSPGIYAEIIGNELHINWEGSVPGNAWSNDITMLLAYNPAKGVSVYDLNAGKRANLKAILLLPSVWKGDEIETYLAFKNANGSVVSESVYTGKFQVC